MVKRDDMGNDREMIKCHFCQKIHHLPDDGKEFPVDTSIPLLLNIKHCTEHDAAKKSFNEVTQLLEKIAKVDKEDYVIDYFERVEADILLEKEVNMQKLLAYFKELVDDVHERKVKCLHNLETNEQLDRELEAIRQTLLEHEGKLKKHNWDLMLTPCWN